MCDRMQMYNIYLSTFSKEKRKVIRGGVSLSILEAVDRFS
jgi:hypothetical protein